MELPSAFDLRDRGDLIPVGEIMERLAEAIAAVEKHERKAVVGLTFAVEYDHESEALTVEATVKSKRPVRSNRNEEVLGEGETVLRLRRQVPGQQQLPGTAEAVAQVRKLDKFLKDNDASMTVRSEHGEATIGKDAAAGK